MRLYTSPMTPSRESMRRKKGDKKRKIEGKKEEEFKESVNRK